jgi:hypothetical protein
MFGTSIAARTSFNEDNRRRQFQLDQLADVDPAGR